MSRNFFRRYKISSFFVIFTVQVLFCLILLVPMSLIASFIIDDISKVTHIPPPIYRAFTINATNTEPYCELYYFPAGPIIVTVTNSASSNTSIDFTGDTAVDRGGGIVHPGETQSWSIRHYSLTDVPHAFIFTIDKSNPNGYVSGTYLCAPQRSWGLNEAGFSSILIFIFFIVSLIITVIPLLAVLISVTFILETIRAVRQYYKRESVHSNEKTEAILAKTTRILTFCILSFLVFPFLFSVELSVFNPIWAIIPGIPYYLAGILPFTLVFLFSIYQFVIGILSDLLIMGGLAFSLVYEIY